MKRYRYEVEFTITKRVYIEVDTKTEEESEDKVWEIAEAMTEDEILEQSHDDHIQKDIINYEEINQED